MASPTRRQREQRKVRTEKAQQTANRTQADPATLYLLWLTSLLPGAGIVLYVRATTPKMRRDGRLEDQRKDAVRRAKNLGTTKSNGLLLRVFCGVESGKPGEPRPMLEAAASFAYLRGAILVVVERSRILRPSNFNGHWEYEWPTVDDWEELNSRFPCLKASFENPALDARRAKLVQSVRGQKKGKGGRPLTRKKEQRLARNLKAVGMTIAVIAARLNIPVSTIGRWVKR